MSKDAKYNLLLACQSFDESLTSSTIRKRGSPHGVVPREVMCGFDWNDSPGMVHVPSSASSSVPLQSKPGDIVYAHQVTKSDVLSGKGRGVAFTEGNQFFNWLVKAHQQEYQSEYGPSQSKKRITHQVLYSIKQQDPEGRFLKPHNDPSRSHENLWIVQDDKFAKKKISQALREKPKKNQQQEKGGAISQIEQL